MGSTSSPPPIRSLRVFYGADFHEIIDYGGFQYHLLLKFNRAEPDCLENNSLKKLQKAMDVSDDESAVEAEAGNCLEIFWPFVEADYDDRLRSIPSQHPTDPIKLQVLTAGGALRTVYHHIDFPDTKPIEHTFPNVATFHSSDIKRLDEIERNIFKIQLGNSIYCLKTIYRSGDDQSFIREVTCLGKCSHPNIIRLVGISVDDKDRADGMIIDYVEKARSLRSVDSISSEEYERWRKQMHDAVTYLHKNGIIWGDAKAANVLIRQDGDIVLVDFGGGHTKGWVDSANKETKNGDLQGLQSITNFMLEKVR